MKKSCYSNHQYPIHDRIFSHPSGASVTDCHFAAFYNNRHFSIPTRKFKHFLQFCTVRLHINVCSPFPIGRQGLVREWSTCFTVNDNFFRHNLTSRINNQLKNSSLITNQGDFRFHIPTFSRLCHKKYFRRRNLFPVKMYIKTLHNRGKTPNMHVETWLLSSTREV
jgi:hypothetical protein